jgi:glycosyltransferase involved in cell wall biosynthesis
MRIVIVADDIDAVGGIQTATHTLAQHLTRCGHQLHVVGLHRNPAPATLSDRPAYQRTVLDAPPSGNSSPSGQRTAQQRLARLLAASAPGVLIMSSVHVSLWLSEIDTAGWARIGHYHGSYEYARTHYHWHVIRDLWPTFDAAVFLSRDDADGFAAHARLHTAWIPNPLPDVSLQTPGLLATPGAPRILAVGRLATIKRFDLAIAAFAHAAIDDWQLHIIGDGDQEQALRRHAAEHGLTASRSGARVVFRGRLPAAAMPAEYAAADLLVMTSDHEGFGMVLAEAAAAGTPSVAFDVSGGVRSLIQHERSGLLIPPGDLDHLTAALRDLMLDHARRRELGAAAPATVRHLAADAVAVRWEALLTGPARPCREKAPS